MRQYLEREDIARRMADYLGEDVSSNMLNAYASESRDAHNISVIRAVAIASSRREAGLPRWPASFRGARQLGEHDVWEHRERTRRGPTRFCGDV